MTVVNEGEGDGVCWGRGQGGSCASNHNNPDGRIRFKCLGVGRWVLINGRGRGRGGGKVVNVAVENWL